ncbi:ABC transporter permease [Streptomyces sp. NPDC002667]|uniref:ABC transporter permease n=1 Tax=Streptomyces sp. NPDC002667 TaxID=3364657 RepID=UPI00368922B7
MTTETTAPTTTTDPPPATTGSNTVPPPTTTTDPPPDTTGSTRPSPATGTALPVAPSVDGEAETETETEDTATAPAAPTAAVASPSAGAAAGPGAGVRPSRRAPGARRRTLAPGRRLPASRLIGPALFLALWALASAAGQLDPGAIPAPWTVLRTTGHLWTDGTLPTDVLTSLERAGYGFAIGLAAGVVLALASGLSRIGEALIDGTVQLNRAIPTLGLIPLFILWLGIGETFKIAIIAIVVYIPIYLNLHSALSGIDHRFVELAEVQGLSRLRFVREIVIPGALPGFFVGLRLGVTASWLSLVVLEQINATSGLGYMMFQAQNYGRTDIILVGLLIYGIFGLVSDSAVRLVERKVLSWRRTLSN